MRQSSEIQRLVNYVFAKDKLHQHLQKWLSENTFASLQVVAFPTLCFFKATCRLDKIRTCMYQLHVPVVPRLDKDGVYWRVKLKDFQRIAICCKKELKKQYLKLFRHTAKRITFVKIYWIAQPQNRRNNTFNKI
ncbi:MAG: hypothetical protein NZ551_11185 [Microscillaceae bacterium]|nr:hypothetical protein [Microscillaceae bacterium]MDW8461760.1 hypothetical protein [Cytophagales bacterium]